KTLTFALKKLSEDTKPLPDPSQIPEVKNPDDPPLHSISLPPEIINYVDSSRNPDIYTREFVELVQRGNQDLKGKAEAFADFRNILAKEMVAALPELKGEVDRTLEGVGEGPIKDPDAMAVAASVKSRGKRSWAQMFSRSDASEDHGIIGPYPDDFTTKIAIATCFGIAWYNAIELCVIVFAVFNQRKGLYFYSLLTSAVFGVIPYALGFLLKFFGIGRTPWPALVLLSIGWWCMVTGQSLVLWSRLHLVVHDKRILQPLLYLILIDVVLLHVPTTVMTLCANATHRSNITNGYNIMEKIQMTGFTCQEFLISSLYIWEAVKMLRVSFDNKNDRKIMLQLLSINLIFILMDIGLVICSFMNYYIYETSIKATVYSVKLKLEFAVLGKMICFAKSRTLPVGFNHNSEWTPEITLSANGFPDFVDPSRLQQDTRHAPDCGKNPPRPPWSDPDLEKTGDSSSQTLGCRKRVNDSGLDSTIQQMRYVRSRSGSWSNGTRFESITSVASNTELNSVIDTPDINSLLSKQKNGRSTYAEWPS
ncbi:hypothetical protein KEM54_005748, partial [Ascosphaera aggregata]